MFALAVCHEPVPVVEYSTRYSLGDSPPDDGGGDHSTVTV